MTRWDEIAAGFDLVDLKRFCGGRVRIGYPPAVGRPYIRKPAHDGSSLITDADLLGRVRVGRRGGRR